ncbi:MAG TPA: SPOR domain-containing protein, partial [Vicinamibacterales bacterium]
PSSVGSQNVMDEVSYALEENKLVVPVLYRDCSIPFRLRRLQYTDFRGNHQEALNKLVAHLIAPPSDASASPASDPADGRVGAGLHTPRQDPAVAVAGPSNPPGNVPTRARNTKAWLAAAMAVVLIAGAWAISSMLGGPAVVDKPQTPSDKWGLVVPTYVVTAGAFKTEREAQALRDKLRSRGYKASHLWIPDYESLSGAQMFLTFVGPFADIEECRKQLAEFKKVEAGAYGILVSHQTGRVQFTR